LQKCSKAQIRPTPALRAISPLGSSCRAMVMSADDGLMRKGSNRQAVALVPVPASCAASKHVQERECHAAYKKHHVAWNVRRRCWARLHAHHRASANVASSPNTATIWALREARQLDFRVQAFRWLWEWTLGVFLSIFPTGVMDNRKIPNCIESRTYDVHFPATWG
jgi:hypothetical protein